MNIREWNRRNAEISKKYDALYHRIAAKHGLSDLQHWVLYVIRSMDGEGELTQNGIAELFSMPKQSVNSAMTKLSEAGYVTLTQCSGPRNSKTAALTEAGVRLCRACVDPLLAAEERALAQIPSAETELFLQLHAKIFDTISEEVYPLGEKDCNET